MAGVALATAGSLAHAETVKIGLPAPVTGPGASIGDLMVKGAQAGGRGHQQRRARGSAQGRADHRGWRLFAGWRIGGDREADRQPQGPRADRRLVQQRHDGGERDRAARKDPHGRGDLERRQDHPAWLRVHLPLDAEQRPDRQGLFRLRAQEGESEVDGVHLRVDRLGRGRGHAVQKTVWKKRGSR